MHVDAVFFVEILLVDRQTSFPRRIFYQAVWVYIAIGKHVIIFTLNTLFSLHFVFTIEISSEIVDLLSRVAKVATT